LKSGIEWALEDHSIGSNPDVPQKEETVALQWVGKRRARFGYQAVFVTMEEQSIQASGTVLKRWTDSTLLTN
jgi:hypothetical protein